MTFALLFTPRPVSALWTRLATCDTKPTWAAEARSIDMVTVRRILTRAYISAPRPVIQDGTLSMAVTARVSWFAKALSCPWMTELCVVLVTRADEGALGAIQLLPLTLSISTGLPLPA